jgi:hypothetical protein
LDKVTPWAENIGGLNLAANKHMAVKVTEMPL